MFGSTLDRERAFAEAEWRARAERPATFLAELDDRDVGLAGVFEVGGEWSVMSMWVDPDARGTGVVDALMSACLTVAHEAGSEQVTLSAMTHNPHALRAYERLGFTRRSVGDPGADGRREVRMSRPLP